MVIEVLQPACSRLASFPGRYHSARLASGRSYCSNASETISTFKGILPQHRYVESTTREKISNIATAIGITRQVSQVTICSSASAIAASKPPGTQQTITPFLHRGTDVDINASNMSAPILVSAASQANSGPYKTEFPVTTAASIPARLKNKHSITYSAIGGLPTPGRSGNRVQRAKVVGYKGLKTVV